jgi:hypothetical protein
MTREDKLISIYWMLSISDKFKADFKEDWKAVSDLLAQRAVDKISDLILDMCFQYFLQWHEG